MPFTPSPPFGETTISNISLEVKAHLPHDHRFLRHRTCWILETGDELPAQQESKNMRQLNVRLLPVTQPASRHAPTLLLICTSDAQDQANRVSSDATFNLFNWHKNNEGGLWLAEDENDSHTARRMQSHPWIKEESDEEAISEGEDSDNKIDEGFIISWRASIIDST